MSADKTEKRWKDLLQIIRDRVSPQTYNTWFSRAKCIHLGNDELLMSVPDLFCKDWLEKNYSVWMKDILVKQMGFQNTILIKFQVDPLKNDHQGKSKGKMEKNYQDIFQKKYDKTGLNIKYTFDNFVVGDSNRFANAACQAVAKSPAKSYNPLFVYGGVGLGKTHLIYAIGNYIINQNSADSINVIYLSAEDFTNDLINSIRDDAPESFREKYRNMDVLLIDDIHFLAGKERTQEEFFHTFNALYNANKQIVITSDRPPKEIPNLENRLISRFEWGLIADIQPPDLETRIAILKKKAQSCQTEFSDDTIQYIAEKIPSNIRQLEGALNKLDAYATLTQTEVDFDLAKQILKEIIPIEVKEVSIPLIQQHTAAYFNLKPAILLSKKRSQNIVTARHIAMYLAREMTDCSLPMIGQSFGGKDHTTVIHSCNKIKGQLKNDKKLQYHIERIKNRIQNSSDTIS